ncbi:MAG: hypothetical protein ACHP7P_11310 [Terriglobales bacterium]
MLAELYDKFVAGKAAAWTAIFTCVLCVFSALLWQVSRDANRASVATQRAFLNYGQLPPMKVPNGTILKGTSWSFIWANSGTTPTKKAVMQSNVYIGQESLQPGLDFDRLPQSERISFALGPKGAIQMKPVSVSVQDLEDLEAGRKHIFFWGWTSYRDIFSDTPDRLSEFCVELTNVVWPKASDHTDLTGDVNFLNPPCKTHNCYDEECEDYKARTK